MKDDLYALEPEHFSYNVVGESNYQEVLRKIVRELRPGKSAARAWAKLVREPNNPYDRNAISVRIKGLTVGYIPRDDAARLAKASEDRLAPLLRSEHPALIVSKPRTFRPLFGVRLCVEI